MLIKIRFEFDRFFKLQNVVKVEFISIHARGEIYLGMAELIAGCIFLVTGRWAYKWGEDYK